MCITARRRAAAKRKKLKNLGKSKSTDTEEEEGEEEGEDGKMVYIIFFCTLFIHSLSSSNIPLISHIAFQSRS